MNYARVVDGVVVEWRQMDPPPPNKAHLWKPIFYEGSGPLISTIVEQDRVRVVRAEIPLPEIKAELSARLAEYAERERGRVLTLAAGKAMSYAEKMAEARLILDDEGNPPSAELVPILSREAAARGLSLLDMARLVRSRYLACKDAEALINEAEVRAVIAISAASDAAAARAAYEAVTWPSMQ